MLHVHRFTTAVKEVLAAAFKSALRAWLTMLIISSEVGLDMRHSGSYE
jgi:hypothetical protein